ncbi:MarR family transcriptional regulator [Streptomyces roseifaciens]
MMARVLACLCITDSGTLTAADLAERLRVSPASVSHAVTYLEQQGMLRRERAPGGRRERYVIDDEVWLRSTLAALQMNEALVAASQRATEILGPTTPAGARFESCAEFLLLVSESLQTVMEQWRQHRSARSADVSSDLSAMTTTPRGCSSADLLARFRTDQDQQGLLP